MKKVNCIFRDQVKKQNFSTFHMRTLENFADVILVRAETIKSFAIYFTICWIIFTSNNVPKTNSGAPLLGLAKSICSSIANLKMPAITKHVKEMCQPRLKNNQCENLNTKIKIR